jgi:hypothetical protein
VTISIKDRVRESTTTTGTGDITLAGAATQYQTFNTAFGLNVFFPYVIAGQTGSEWECGVGYLSGATTLVRAVSASSNSNALVNFSAGTKDVWCDLTAKYEDDQNNAIELTQMMGFYLP